MTDYFSNKMRMSMVVFILSLVPLTLSLDKTLAPKKANTSVWTTRNLTLNINLQRKKDKAKRYICVVDPDS